MMHKNGFVIAVRNSSKLVLREELDKNKNISNVFLPRNSNFSVILKNTKNNQSVSELIIGNKKLFGNRKIILPPKTSLYINCFFDNNLKHQKDMIFIPDENDKFLIEATFWEETCPAKDPKKSIPNIRNNFRIPWEFLDEIEEKEGVFLNKDIDDHQGIFSVSRYGELGPPTYIPIQIKPFSQGKTVKNTRFLNCPACDFTNTRTAKYCSNCGKNISVI